MTASAHRLQVLEGAQTVVARKVLAAIPISDSWSWQKIIQEHARLKTPVEPHIMLGCINSLKRAGLIKETAPGVFQRVHKKLDPSVSENPKPQGAVVSKTPSDQIASIASKLRGLATDLDNVAIALEEKSSEDSAEITKLRQLKAALAALS